MNNETPALPLVDKVENLTPIVVKSKLEKTLIAIESGIQTLTDKEAALVYNSDHLQEIADYVNVVKAAQKKLEAERVALKNPYKTGGETVDAGAKLVNAELDKLLKKAGDKYTEMAKEQARLQKIQDDEIKRVKDIKEAIDTTIMTYSTKIAEAKDLSTLLDLERRLNLETANEKRYQEQLPSLKERCEAIRSLLSLQKQNVRELEGLENQAANALETGQDEVLMEIESQKEEMGTKVEETRTKIQETAINQSITAQPSRVTQVFNTVKPSRTTTEWTIIDMATFQKKHPDWVKVIAVDKSVDDYVKIRKAEITDDNPEIIVDGLRIFQQKKYI